MVTLAVTFGLSLETGNPFPSCSCIIVLQFLQLWSFWLIPANTHYRMGCTALGEKSVLHRIIMHLWKK